MSNFPPFIDPGIFQLMGCAFVAGLALGITLMMLGLVLFR